MSEFPWVLLWIYQHTHTEEPVRNKQTGLSFIYAANWAAVGPLNFITPFILRPHKSKNLLEEHKKIVPADLGIFTWHMGIYWEMLSGADVHLNATERWLCLINSTRFSWEPADQRDTAEHLPRFQSRLLLLSQKLWSDFQPESRVVMKLLISSLLMEQNISVKKIKSSSSK